MALVEFIKKQFIDIIEWTEGDDGTVAWRYPMAGNEIQYGASLTVRESQQALFVNEGRIADVFGPGRYRLITSTLPVLTYLNHWDKLFASPFKSDVHFFSTRLQLDRRWGTQQPVTLRDRDFGAVRVRAHGNYSWRIADPRRFHLQVGGTRARVTVAELDEQLRALLVQHLSDAVAGSGIPFLDLAANLVSFAGGLQAATAEDFAALGLELQGVTVQSISLPEELQKLLDQRIGMGMVGPDMGRFLQYQAAQSLPQMAAGAGGQGGGGSGVLGDALGLGAGVALGQVMAQQLAQGLAPATAAGTVDRLPGQAVTELLEKLAELRDKGVLTAEEFAAKKAELLGRL